MVVYVAKGDTVTAHWFQAHIVSLSGQQDKYGATDRTLTGMVRHVRSEHPIEPVNVKLYVEDPEGDLCPKCGVSETMIDPAWIVDVMQVPVVPEWLQVRLWLDDQWADPDMPARHPPPGWTPVATAMEACRFIRTGCVVEIDFDHDLGKGPNGAVVARYIEIRAFRQQQPTPAWAIHSANPVGRQNIMTIMCSAERFWK